jgi:putative effector of murein hydrolase
VNRSPNSPRVLRSCLFLLAALQVTALLIAFERPAQAYVDPGSGFVFLQVAGSMLAGAVYYLRHRLKRAIASIRRPAQVSSSTSTQTEVAENRP